MWRILVRIKGDDMSALTATPRQNYTQPKTPTLAQALRDKAIALGALEQIASTGGIPGVIARETLARIRGEKR